MIITNARIYCPDHTFREGSLQAEADRITQISLDDSTDVSSNISNSETVIDADGCYLIPGLIDIHFHGCMGADFSDGTREALDTIVSYELSQGVTGITPATMTLPFSQLEQVFQTAAEYAAKQKKNAASSPLLGIHVEGPYFSESKKGAQAAEHLRLPSISELMHFQEQAEGLITQVDVAPELPGALEFIQKASQTMTVSLGHSAATYDEGMAGFAAGASHATHLFNGMMPFAHREPGLVGAAADCPDVRVEMICDGIHLHPAMIRSMFRLFGEERILLISDSIRATGMPDGEYSLGGQPVRVQNGIARLADGTIAGSTTSLLECLRRVVSFGIPLETAVRCAGENQAKELGIFSQLGSLETGKLANLVLLSSDLKLQAVFLAGKQVI